MHQCIGVQVADLGIKKDRLSTTDTGQKTNGRWGIRTHDPLIKSQLLENTNDCQSKDLAQAKTGAYKPAYKQNSKTGQNEAFEIPSDLAEIVSVWSSLPEHIKQAIKSLTQTHMKEPKL